MPWRPHTNPRLTQGGAKCICRSNKSRVPQKYCKTQCATLPNGLVTYTLPAAPPAKGMQAAPRDTRAVQGQLRLQTNASTPPSFSIFSLMSWHPPPHAQAYIDTHMLNQSREARVQGTTDLTNSCHKSHAHRPKIYKKCTKGTRPGGRKRRHFQAQTAPRGDHSFGNRS